MSRGGSIRSDWHVWCGEAVLALVLFRLAWGFFGSETARFAGLFAAPRAAVRHLAHLLRREPDREVGHNPAGGWMVALLLALLLVETLTGLYVNNDVADAGPLTELVPARIDNLVTALHTIVWDVLVAAVALHVLAIVVYAVAKGQNLTRAMITRAQEPARQRPGAATGIVDARARSPWRERRRGGAHRQFPVTVRQDLGGITWPRISPPGWVCECRLMYQSPAANCSASAGLSVASPLIGLETACPFWLSQTFTGPFLPHSGGAVEMRHRGRTGQAAIGDVPGDDPRRRVIGRSAVPVAGVSTTGTCWAPESGTVNLTTAAWASPADPAQARAASTTTARIAALVWESPPLADQRTSPDVYRSGRHRRTAGGELSRSALPTHSI